MSTRIPEPVAGSPETDHHAHDPAGTLAYFERYFQAWLTRLGIDPEQVQRLARETALPAATLGAAREV